MSRSFVCLCAWQSLENEGLSAEYSCQFRQVAVEPVHPSHGRRDLLSGDNADGSCLIESAVLHDHCCYCFSYGH